MIKAGAHPKQIQTRCGHATIKETMDTYGALFPAHDDELVRALESFRPREAKVIELWGRSTGSTPRRRPARRS